MERSARALASNAAVVVGSGLELRALVGGGALRFLKGCARVPSLVLVASNVAEGLR